jgi:tRNA-2-methylthio-N6-dimethylallyladenosine synthase
MSPHASAPGPRVYLEDMGCQMNRLDSELVRGRLRQAGFQRVEDPAGADVILYYTCSVREHAEDKVYARLGTLRRWKDRRPDLVVGVMGCMAQNHKERIFERAPHVDLVVGTSRFEDVVDLLEEVRHGERVLAVDRRELDFAREPADRPRRHHAFLSAMRGCNKFCTFCIVPFTQGRERSRPRADVVAEARRLVDDGVVEITLLGQRIDTYGLDLRDGSTLAVLLGELHEACPELLRIGFITSHPGHVDRALAETIAALPRVSRYIHLPVQSGSDRILRDMNRGYSTDEYRRAVALLREAVPEMAIATDWIVGFPGETGDDFEESVRLLHEIGFAGSFVFKYSPREGTRAYERGDPVPLAEKEKRNHALLEAQKEVSLARHRQWVGRTVQVLVEGPSKRDASRLTGRTGTNLIVHFPGPLALAGRMAEVRIESATALTVQGVLAAPVALAS